MSIWITISPDTFLEKFKTDDLARYFNRTEFGHDGDRWYFPKLLHKFVILVKNKKTNTKEIVDYLFEMFNFFSDPETFIREILGYGSIKEFH